MRYLLSLFIIITGSLAQNVENNASYIDKTHGVISDSVIEWSSYLDDTLSDLFTNKDENRSNPKRSRIQTYRSISIDGFFQNQRYFDETENTFIHLHTESLFQTQDTNHHKFLISGQIPLSRSRDNLKLFIDDLNVDNAKNLADEMIKDNNLLPDIGIRYVVPESYKKIHSRYALGLSGIHPFVNARFNLPVNYDAWLIDAVQKFEYSTNDKFEEETNIYLDRAFNDLSLFRLQIHRKTQTEVKGMDYALSLQYYWSFREKSGMRFVQSFFANTQYTYEYDDHQKSYGGINNYVTSLSWRENIWRDWFYYEVRPSVNFHIEHDYHANYAIYLFFDFYFGE